MRYGIEMRSDRINQSIDFNESASYPRESRHVLGRAAASGWGWGWGLGGGVCVSMWVGM